MTTETKEVLRHVALYEWTLGLAKEVPQLSDFPDYWLSKQPKDVALILREWIEQRKQANAEMAKEVELWGERPESK